MKRVAISGGQGFLGSFLCRELLENDFLVTSIDNFSKYGELSRSHDDHPNFNLIRYDLRDGFPDIKYDYLIAGASLVGGVGYFNAIPYTLLRDNEKIVGNTIDHAIKVKPEKVVMISSSMVFERAEIYPTPEEHVCPAPITSYGFQKMACEKHVEAAYKEFGLNYTIVRPFNCVGAGEYCENEANKLSALSHVLPDLVHKTFKCKHTEELKILGQGDQVRAFTHGRDIARGIRLAMEKGGRTAYNISTPTPTTVKELAEKIWEKIHGGKSRLICEKPFDYDVKYRLPDVSKAYNELGFRAQITLDESIDEVIEEVRQYL